MKNNTVRTVQASNITRMTLLSLMSAIISCISNIIKMTLLFLMSGGGRKFRGEKFRGEIPGYPLNSCIIKLVLLMLITKEQNLPIQF